MPADPELLRAATEDAPDAGLQRLSVAVLLALAAEIALLALVGWALS
jgi:hypothetical protein